MNNYSNDNSPLKVLLKRGSSTESIHNVHVVATDVKGRILLFAGNPYYETYIRSALKPFQALPFISSGAAEQIKSDDKSL